VYLVKHGFLLPQVYFDAVEVLEILILGKFGVLMIYPLMVKVYIGVVVI
jgi:hypothetical protein